MILDFFTLMTDESTDIAVLKQLVLVARYMTETGAKISFLLIRDIHDGTAETIETALWQGLMAKSLDITRLRGFGSDGAAVMTGRMNGVAAQLKRHSPRIISVHCVAHRLALAAAHAADGIPYLQLFKSILQTLPAPIVTFMWLAANNKINITATFTSPLSRSYTARRWKCK